MKKIITAAFVLLMVLSLTACGGASKSENGHVADKFANLLEKEDSTYYYEAKLTEEFFDTEEEEEAEESVMAEARDGKDKLVILSGEDSLDQRWIEGKGKVDYTVDDLNKSYSELEKDDDENTSFKYVKTDEMELDGKTYQYDEYQDEFDIETSLEDDEVLAIEDDDSYVYIKRYLVDSSGDLYAIVYKNEKKGKEGEANKLIHERVERITKFEANKAPDGVFDIPKDYKKVDPDEM